jgi:carboxyl-terminal processing protease
MMRKITLLMFGAVLGAGISTLATQGRLLSTTSAVAAASDTYRQLNLFGDVFEKIRSDYVEKPDEAEADRGRDQRHADLARPALELH